jgi:hypothetical protein
MYVAFSKRSKCAALRAAFATEIEAAVDNGTVQKLLEAAENRQGRLGEQMGSGERGAKF